jgi:hypothetical protein
MRTAITIMVIIIIVTTAIALISPREQVHKAPEAVVTVAAVVEMLIDSSGNTLQPTNREESVPAVRE